MQIVTPSNDFTGFDWFLVVVIVVSSVAAFRRGLIRVLLSVGGLFTGIIVASWEYLQLAVILHRWFASFQVSEVVSFLLILALIIAIFGVIARTLRKTVQAVGLGFADRLLGGVFGVIRGLLLGVAAMMAVTAFVPDASWVQNSQLAPYFLSGVHAISFVVPEHFQDQISAGARYLLHETPELLRPHTLQQHL